MKESTKELFSILGEGIALIVYIGLIVVSVTFFFNKEIEKAIYALLWAMINLMYLNKKR